MVSLSYCRHAVKRNAKRLAEMRTGQSDANPEEVTPEGSGACESLVSTLKKAAESQGVERPAVAAVLIRVVAQVETACAYLVAAMLDEYFFGLEAEMFHDCWAALPDHERSTIEAHVEKAADGTSATDEAKKRSTKALRDRELRLLLNLPRLEVG